MQDKQALREHIWSTIDANPDIGRPPGARNRIPNHAGAEAAAQRLAATPEWQRARVVKLNPDTPQLWLRARAIEDGKLVYMAVPKLANDAPFTTLEKSRLSADPLDAATIDGAARHGRPTRLEEMQPIDLVVCGSVAVNADGVRIGKGGGYADIEHGLLSELGLVTAGTFIATTVHDVQLLDGPLPETPHDFRVDAVATPTRLVRCERVPRPQGIQWDQLDPAKLANIPALRASRRS